MSIQVLLWVIFNLFVIAMLALDLGVFHRKRMSSGSGKPCVVCALGRAGDAVQSGNFFAAWFEPALEFLTGYLLE